MALFVQHLDRPQTCAFQQPVLNAHPVQAFRWQCEQQSHAGPRD